MNPDAVHGRAAVRGALIGFPIAVIFMTAIAAIAWLLISLPAIVRASRINLVDALRDDPRVMPVTRGGTRLRQVLMSAQVALTVLLLIGALLIRRRIRVKARG